MQHALWAGAFCVCGVLASSAPAASQTISLLNNFAFGYVLGGGVEAGSRQVLENILAEVAANYAHDPNSATACQVVAPSEPNALLGRTTTYLQSVWPLADRSKQLQQQLASFALKDYLPDIHVSIHQESTDAYSVRVMRAARTPGS